MIVLPVLLPLVVLRPLSVRLPPLPLLVLPVLLLLLVVPPPPLRLLLVVVLRTLPVRLRPLPPGMILMQHIQTRRACLRSCSEYGSRPSTTSR